MNPLRIVSYHPHEHTIVVLGRTIHLRRRGDGDKAETSAPLTQAEADHLRGAFAGDAKYAVKGTEVSTPEVGAEAPAAAPTATPVVPPGQPAPPDETASSGADTHAGGLTPEQPTREP